MSKEIVTIAIDAMGGENSPQKTIEGLSIFLQKNKNQNYFFFNLYGDEEKISKELDKQSIKSENLKIYHTKSIVSDEESPITAVKNSKDSSMWHTINSQIIHNSDISISAGNTGVLFVISRMILKTMKQINKPALAGLWPNKSGTNVVLDLGANIECDENNLVDFAEMGSALYKFYLETRNQKFLF